MLNATAIALSCGVIVLTSIVIGASLPFVMIRCGQDPVHSGAAVQVLMDLWGVLVSCVICKFLLAHATQIPPSPHLILPPRSGILAAEAPPPLAASGAGHPIRDKGAAGVVGQQPASAGDGAAQADGRAGHVVHGDDGVEIVVDGKHGSERRLLGNQERQIYGEALRYTRAEVEAMLAAAVDKARETPSTADGIALDILRRRPASGVAVDGAGEEEREASG